MKTIWRMKNDFNVEDIDNFSKTLGVSKALGLILYSRGIQNIDDAEKFLNPKLRYLHSPRNMMDMDKGTNIILDAINQKKSIVIYGDYDCDGVTSTTIMYKGLLKCGARVSYHLPDRIEEGYGLNSETIKKLHKNGCEVIITCDNGISCIEQVKLAKSLGMTVVITDHHEIPFEVNERGEKIELIPDADAVINPKRSDCKYPFKHLCGAGVAFKFIQTMYHKCKIDSKELHEFIELAAIGTICDVVELTGENRIIASIGIKMLNQTTNKGLRALIREIGYEGKKLRSGNIGFQLGPCINATGRLESAEISVELLMSEDESKAEDMAKKLRRLNKERQDLTNKALEEIILQIENSKLINDKVLVVYKHDLHESLAGIIAGRLRDRYNRPALVITKAKESAKGSGRSIEEYDMFSELTKCKDLLIKVGGHPMAAGFSLLEENIDGFRKMLNENCKLTEKDLTCKIDIDEVLKIQDINMEFINEIEKLEPFGKGNKEPLFKIENTIIEKIDIIGKNKDMFKFLCKQSGVETSMTAVKFSEADMLITNLKEYVEDIPLEEVMRNPMEINLKMDIVFKPSINEWNNNISVQMLINDYRIL
ncbi:recombination protein RecJ [Fervidicella metallireducens AeB]|uniref:Single-stranded-DNA-specific exonuclease RecJ n=1 Tax=Fervidicella metallireducens AeB TaxID=1403537 RepID=A0A017RV05_9CLOT|nr:single-stranded-DNA-specific exonuclease RecJ [Fervidicella metallireducens]EYE88568.1 recombination protein RecJ [Fervidicella metallireducens AeB]